MQPQNMALLREAWRGADLAALPDRRSCCSVAPTLPTGRCSATKPVFAGFTQSACQPTKLPTIAWKARSNHARVVEQILALGIFPGGDGMMRIRIQTASAFVAILAPGSFDICGRGDRSLEGDVPFHAGQREFQGSGERPADGKRRIRNRPRAAAIGWPREHRKFKLRTA